MPSINNVTVDDLTRILLYACGTPATDTNEWKSMLPMLWVCPLWTRLLFASIYDRAFIARGTSATLNGAVQWQSNISCIATRQCFKQIRCLSIKVHEQVESEEVFHTLVDMLMLSTTDWPGVQQLDISFMFILLDAVPIDYATIENSTMFAQQLVHRMPNITRLSLECTDFIERSLPLCKIFLDGYTDKLRSIKLDPYASTIVPYFNAQLASLDVRFDTDILETSLLPAVNAKSLRSLRLSDVLPNFSWKPFHGSCASGKITFNSLECLEINFVTPTGMGNAELESEDWRYSGYEMHFPKLNRLLLSNCPPTCNLMYAKVNESILNFVRIGGLSKHLNTYSHFGVNAPCFELRPTIPYGDSMRSFYELTNKIFGQRRNQRRTTLTMNSSVTELDYLQTSWAHVTDLVIDNYDISVEVLLKLIVHLPWLKRLAIFELMSFSTDRSLDDIRTLLNLYLGKNDIDICLKQFELKHEGANLSHAWTSNFIQQMLIHLRMLEVLAIPDCYVDEMKQSIYNTGFKTPHLSNILVKRSQ